MIEDVKVTDQLAPQDMSWLDDRLCELNVERTGIDDGRYLVVLVRDAAGAVVAGLYGWT